MQHNQFEKDSDMASNLRTMSYTELYTTVQGVIDAAKGAAEMMRSNGLLTIKGRWSTMADLDKQNGWTASLDAVTAELERRSTEAEAASNAVRADVLGAARGETDVVAVELRAARFWARARAELDASTNPVGTVVQLLNESTAADVVTLTEELPSYLHLRKIDLDLDVLLAARFPAIPAAKAVAYWAAMRQNNGVAPLVRYAREVVKTPENNAGQNHGVPLQLAGMVQLDAQAETAIAKAAAA